MFSNMALAGAIAFILFGIFSLRREGSGTGIDWKAPAFLSFLFFAYSAWTILNEGIFGFWVNHTSNLWGLQVWFDLLLAASISWFALLPRMKKVGMNGPFWFVMVATSGSIGLLAALSRLSFLEKSRSGTLREVAAPETRGI